MYTYCHNNPIVGVDPSGNFVQFVLLGAVVLGAALLTGCSDSGNSSDIIEHGPFNSADDAALDFANNIYSSSIYIRHEYATEIYSKNENSKTNFYYKEPWFGNPHSVSLSFTSPKNTSLVAYAHTHPNSVTFSQPDINVANNNSINGYMADPNFDLHRYDFSTQTQSIVGQFTPLPLTQEEMDELELQFRPSWENHFGTCDFNCQHMVWPTQ